MGFENCHPAVNFIFYAAVLYGTIAFDHPIFLAIAYGGAFLYSIKIKGWKAFAFNLCLLPFVFMFALYYGSYHHFGVTILSHNWIGNNMTFESFVYGLSIGFRAAAVIMWCESLFKILTTDKIVYLFGAFSPHLSLFLTILLRFIPRLQKEAKQINMARKGIGRGINQGSFGRRFLNGMSIFSMLITWTIDALAREADSMKSRGSRLRGRKAFSLYRFDNRDRAFVIAFFCGIILMVMAVILGGTRMYYSPRIIWEMPDAMGILTAIGYAFLCFLPLGLEIWTEYNFQRSKKLL